MSYLSLFIYLYMHISWNCLASLIKDQRTLLETFTESQNGWGWQELWRSLCHLEWAVQSSVWWGFEYLQGWRFCNPSGQPAPVFGLLHSKKRFLLCLSGVSCVAIYFSGCYWLYSDFIFLNRPLPSGIYTQW